ncbi:MAG TPA: hypothetical protein VFT75_10425 [Nocardioidaceae bacterium]|jgi:hypothetical protein|nr:hypothetical protein [Nocardioidaceae bacterium]
MSTSRPPNGRAGSVAMALDAAVGVSVLALRTGDTVVRVARRRISSGARHLPRPAVPGSARSSRMVQALVELGADRRAELRRTVTAELARRLDLLVPVVLSEVLRRVGLTDLVLDYLDVDRVVESVDLDAAVRRVDVDQVLRSIDLDAAIALVDLDRAAARLDVDAVVRRVDVESVLDRIDLTDVVLQRVDLDALVRAVLARIDMVGLAEQVIDGVDLPEIIRESTGSMASESVRGARMQGIAADQAVGRAMDRLLLRRGVRRGIPPAGQVPVQPGPEG